MPIFDNDRTILRDNINKIQVQESNIFSIYISNLIEKEQGCVNIHVINTKKQPFI